MNSQSPPPLPGRPFLSSKKIQTRIQVLGKEISEYYHHKPLTLIGLMNGSLFFLVDLARHLPPTTHIECWKVNSYDGKRSTGKISGLDAISGNYKGRHVLIIDDILDTGLTLSEVHRKSVQLKAESVQTCVLLSKKKKREKEYNAKWIGFEIEDHFVIGYGLDFNHNYRTLPMIRILD